MRAVIIDTFGGPEVLRVADLPAPAPGPGEALVAVAASGVNFIDVYHRTGRYPSPLPLTLGFEGAGTVAAIGVGVTEVAVGDRVGWVNVLGSHAELAVLPAAKLIALPAAVEAEVAAAALLQGLTAHYLTHTSYPVRPDDTILVHAAAGGMGLLLTQLVTHLGARVIGTASTPEKAARARAAGAVAVVGYDAALDAVRELTGGMGVAAVYDGVGRDTFNTTLNSLRPRGVFVSYGSASGPVPPVDPMALNAAGSVFFTRPSLGHHIGDRAELLSRAGDLLGWLADGTLSVDITGRFPLSRAGEAYRALEGRHTTGKLLIIA